MKLRSVLMCVFLLAGALRASADPAPNAVTDWALIVQQSIHNAAAPRSAGTSEILHTTVMLAVYDAVIAIEGGFEPYATRIQAPVGADARAAAATAAYRTARARVAASQVAFLDTQYAAYMATIADGSAKTGGVQVGEQAAAGILALRANDNFSNVVFYECSGSPVAVGEFEPDAGCPTTPTSPQPVDAKVGRILPFTYANASDFRPSGTDPMTSSAYAEDFNETREYGRIDSAVRSAEQTDVAYFWAENPYVHWNRNLVRLAVANGLSLRDAARFFAMVHTSAADAVIAGFEAKYFYSHVAAADGDSPRRCRRQSRHRRRPDVETAADREPSGVSVRTRILVHGSARSGQRVLRQQPRDVDPRYVQGGGSEHRADRAHLPSPQRDHARRDQRPHLVRTALAAFDASRRPDRPSRRGARRRVISSVRSGSPHPGAWRRGIVPRRHGTLRFSSSAQPWTTTMGLGLSTLSCLTITNRLPSALTS